MKTQSWIIIELSSNRAVLETWSKSIVKKINQDKYKAVPVLEYLQSLNKQV